MKLNSLIRNKHANTDTKIDTLWSFLERETFSCPVLLQTLSLNCLKLRAMANTNYKVNAAASA